MGDAAEGLIDADLRIQERMEELEQERKAARKAAPTKDPGKVRELESCRLARIELQRQFDATQHPARKEQLTYDDYLADFNAEFHDLRDTRGFQTYLAPDSYEASQALAAALLEAGALGIVYPSVRRAGGTCLVCFRPALVGHVRRGHRWRLTWRGGAGPTIKRER